ncbi:hypothetical protein Mapa_006370 [Marchantia paleacea]|nr:hypothetical protein Mapa_006370 [Marchantia paleacea]
MIHCRVHYVRDRWAKGSLYIYIYILAKKNSQSSEHLRVARVPIDVYLGSQNSAGVSAIFEQRSPQVERNIFGRGWLVLPGTVSQKLETTNCRI